jgi:hypothetical protein
MKEAPGSSETSVLTRATRRNNPEDTILHSHRRENLKSYTVWNSNNVFLLKYLFAFRRNLLPSEGRRVRFLGQIIFYRKVSDCSLLENNEV